MARIRLLTSIAGDGPVLDVDPATARTWADGVRAERVIERQARPERAVDVDPRRGRGAR